MKEELKRAVVYDDKWTTIIYYNDLCSGELKIKKALYEIKKKKIDRLLKDMVIEILEEGGEQ